MAKNMGAMHVARVVSRQRNKAGQERVYETYLLRRSVREGAKVKHETLANLTRLPVGARQALTAALSGKTVLVAGEGLQVTRSLPHGHVAAVAAQAAALGLPAILGPACRSRDIVMGLIIARICRPASKLATTRWWADSTLAEDYNLTGIGTDEVYQAMDWLAARQEGIERKLARRFLNPEVDPDRLALFDLSSSWVTGEHCPLAKRGYSRDGKKALPQIEYGLLTDPKGRPVAIRVLPGNTADPRAFEQIAVEMKTVFGLDQMVMVGDRGMITSARIRQLRQLGGLGWVTALRSVQIKGLMTGDGPIQQSLFDETNLAEITHPDYPGERLIACHNPALAAKRAHKRDQLLTATETDLTKITTAVTAGRLKTAGAIGLRAGKILGRHNMAKHFTLTIDDSAFTYCRNQEAICAEAALDGIYIIRTSVPASRMDAATVVATYKSLANVERDFRSIKAIDLDLRPIYHWTDTRVTAHVFLCMLAALLVWHLRKAWAPLTYTDQNRPEPVDPVTPAKRSATAQTKASTHTTDDGEPARDFTSLLNHLATLTRNTIHITGQDQTATFDILATPTPTQARAFELISQTIPLTLK